MRPFKYNSGRQNVFFASDFHLAHLRDFIWKPRGFVDHVSHTNAVIDGINKKVGEDDVLFYLGDFSLNSSPDETKSFFRRIKCKHVYFIWGNHESSTGKIYKEARDKWLQDYCVLDCYVPDEIYPLRWENVIFVGPQREIVIDNQLILLSHFAHYAWDNMQHGAWNLCGHCHGNAPKLNPDYKEAKVLDVGVDNALKQTGTPCFSYAEVKVIVDKKVFVPLDHHDSNTS
jgi:calcineurin-like phosphoesterase family protein